MTLQAPFGEKVENHGRGIEGGGLVVLAVVVVIRRYTRPVMTNARVKDMLDESSVRTSAVRVQYCVRGHNRRHVLGGQPVSLGPVMDVVRDRWQARAVVVIVALIRDGGVIATVELEERNLGAARGADNLDRVGWAGREGVDVESAGHGRKGGDALGEVVVTGKDTDESATLGLASGIDAAGVDAVVLLQVIDDAVSEADVVGVGSG